ncbi:MAG: thiol-disulfide oxidoreductase DCC family protein [Actinomycetota bacterium]
MKRWRPNILSDVSPRNTSATLTTPTLVYDGDCAFCMACVRFVTRRTTKPLTTVAYQTADLAALGLTREQCADAVQWVSGSTRQSAHIAVAAALRHARFPWPLAGFVISVPVARNIASLVYQRVAARRRCAAPTPPAAP